jgi:hypothetical protein
LHARRRQLHRLEHQCDAELLGMLNWSRHFWLHDHERNRHHFDAFSDKHRKLARRDAGNGFSLCISLASGLTFRSLNTFRRPL